MAAAPDDRLHDHAPTSGRPHGRDPRSPNLRKHHFLLIVDNYHALFELGDALLTAGPVLSPAHLSFEAVHRRGWGSLYAALARGAVDAGALRTLLARHPLVTETPIYAVDVSVWPRCDAEASPDRGYYYHPSRHSAGQPIVAGWAYQWVAQLGLTRDS